MARVTACPDCGVDVLTQPDGTRLGVDRTRFGLHFPDGTALTLRELAETRGQIKGHPLHFCTPRPAAPTAAPSDQLGLF